MSNFLTKHLDKFTRYLDTNGIAYCVHYSPKSKKPLHYDTETDIVNIYPKINTFYVGTYEFPCDYTHFQASHLHKGYKQTYMSFIIIFKSYMKNHIGSVVFQRKMKNRKETKEHRDSYKSILSEEGVDHYLRQGVDN